MFELVFYEDGKGYSSIVELLDKLKQESSYDKNARISRNKILAYMQKLASQGTLIGMPFVRKLGGRLWELRPGNYRIFFFLWKNNMIVLLHYYIKKSKRTPVRELLTAQNNISSLLKRYGK